MSAYECTNPECAMVGHVDGRRVCLGCGKPKRRVKDAAWLS